MIKKNRKFGLVVGGTLIAYTAAQYLLKHKHNPMLLGLGVCLVLLAWLKPYWLGPLQIAWEKIGFIMGVVNTFIVLTVFYYVLLSPIAIIRRLIIKPIKRFPGREEHTYWQNHIENDNDHFKNQY
jgi:hypothetical protein